MGNMVIYHGSKKIVSSPDMFKCVPYNDFGPGLYCTSDMDSAGEWACQRGVSGFINKFEIDCDDIKILNLSDKKYTVMNWLALVITNRSFKIDSPNVGRFVAHLRKNFLPDISDVDIIIGPRCDDSYFSFVRMFLNGKISYKLLKSTVSNGSAGTQVCLRSQKAFDKVEFVTYTRADAENYYPKRKIKDYNTRASVLAQIEIDGGLYVHDIIREEIMPDDSRL